MKPFMPQQKNGGVIHFQGIEGKAEVWIDGKLSATKGDFSPGPLLAPFPPGTEERKIRILMESKEDKPIGFSSIICIQPKD